MPITTSHRGRVMGSELVIVVAADHDRIDGGDLAADVHTWLSEVEQRWSRFIATSDISRLNLAEGEPTVVDPLTITLLATMQAAHAITRGAYDPTILPTMVESGYAASRLDPLQRTILPPSAFRTDERPAGDVAGIVLDTESCTARLPAGVVIDPGGIGKGLAADLAVRELLERGAIGGLVSIGGDLAAGGVAPADDGWVIEVERSDVDVPDGHGDDVPVLLTVTISGGGVATSSTRSRRWIADGTERHHVIDPRTRQQSRTDLAGVTVVAPTGWEAEAHATAALLAGSAGVVDHLRAHHLEGVAVTLDGMVIATEQLAALVEPTEG